MKQFIRKWLGIDAIHCRLDYTTSAFLKMSASLNKLENAVFNPPQIDDKPRTGNESTLPKFKWHEIPPEIFFQQCESRCLEAWGQNVKRPERAGLFLILHKSYDTTIYMKSMEIGTE